MHCDMITTQRQRMRSMMSVGLIGHIKFLPWQQLDGYSMTRHLISLRRVWLARVDVCMVNTGYVAWQVRGSLSSLVHPVYSCIPPLSLSNVCFTFSWCHLCDEWFQVLPVVSHSFTFLCCCHSKPKNKQWGQETWLGWSAHHSELFIPFPRDPRLVPMTYGPQAVYRPIDNGLGRLRVTVSQVRVGRL